MDKKPKPPQFGLRGLFKLTTWAAVLSAVFAMLPGETRKFIGGMLLALAGGVLLALTEALILNVVVAIWRSARRAFCHLSSHGPYRSQSIGTSSERQTTC
jgi:hypothetical protein